MINTTDEKGNKALGGGTMKRQMPQQTNINSIDVKSVDEYSSTVQQLGGKVVYPKMAITGMGYFAFDSIQKTMLWLYGNLLRALCEYGQNK